MNNISTSGDLTIVKKKWNIFFADSPPSTGKEEFFDEI